MDTYFKIYLLSGIIIIFLIVIISTRKKYKKEYRDRYFNKENKPLKYIPKKIFQMVADKNNISPEFKKNIKYIQDKNKNWEYNLLDDKDIEKYIEEKYGKDMLLLYGKINPKYGACKGDFARYLIMYLEGGVYFDIKSASKFPLDQIILPEDQYILSYWDLPFKSAETGSFYGEFQQWHIICRPRHPFLYGVIKEVIHNINSYTKDKGVGKEGVLKLSGPIVYTNIIKNMLKNSNLYRIIELNDFAGLIYNNTTDSYKNLFSSTHYSKITEPIIL